MKAIHFLPALLAMTCACAQEAAPAQADRPEVITAPEYVRYAEGTSSDHVISLEFDASGPITGGAKSFTLELTRSLQNDAEAEISKTIKVFAPRKIDVFSFKDLESGARYYARVRANFTEASSDWVYVCRDGNPVVLAVGQGPIDGPVSVLKDPEARLKAVSAGTLSFEWSVTGFEDWAFDNQHDWRIALYRNEACTDLEVSWDFLAEANLNVGYLISGTSIRNYHAPAFQFTGLEPATDYWFVVSDISNPENPVSAPAVKATTEVSQKTLVGPEKVQEGHWALYEDFDQLLWGSGTMTYSAGYSSNARGTLTTFEKATGDNPVGEATPHGFYLVNDNDTQMVLFNTIRKIIPSTSLKDWGYLPEAEISGSNSTSRDAVCARAGHIRLGAGDYFGEIVTPPLDNLRETATVEVSFDAFNSYVRHTKHFKIDLISDAVRGDDFSVTGGTVDKAEVFDIEPGYEPQHYCFTIPNVRPGTRIGLGADRREVKETINRFYMDNIAVKVVSYGETQIALRAPEIRLEVSGRGIAVSWDAVPLAKTYQVEYRKGTDGAWTEALGAGQDGCRIGKLTAGATYQVRARAVAGISTSDWSAVQTIVYDGPDYAIEQKAIVLNEAQIGVKWSVTGFTDLQEDALPAYRIALYKDEAAKELIYAWQLDEGGTITRASASKKPLYLFHAGGTAAGALFQPGYLFTGLEPQTDYWVQISSDDLTSLVKYTTATDDNIILPEKAGQGDIILRESFNQLAWGGDPIDYLPGISTTQRAARTGFAQPEGAEPATEWFVVDNQQDMGLFATVWKSASKTRTGAWRGYIVANGNNGAQGTMAMAGIIKFGASSRNGYLVTPALTCLSGKATLKVKVRAAYYSGTATGVRVAVFPKDAPTVNNYPQLIDYTADAAKPVYESPAQTLTKEWADYEFTVSAEPGQSIGIGTEDLGATAKQFFLNSVEIQVVEMEQGTTPDPDPDPDPQSSISQRAEFIHNTQIAVRWSGSGFEDSSADLATAWTWGIYKDEACTEPVYGVLSLAASAGKFFSGVCPGYVFSLLEPGTDYWVKIASGDDASVAKYTTSDKDRNGVLTGEAKAGDLILAQDFDELAWGCGDFIRKLVGFNHLSSYTAGPFTPQTSSSGLVNSGVMNLLNGVWGAGAGTNGATWFASTSLAPWRGTGAIPSGAGYLRLDANGRYFVSPALDCLKQKARVRVSFEAAGNYKEAASVNLAVFPKETTRGANDYLITDTPVSTWKAGELELNVWETASAEITLEKGQRIGFGRADATQAFYLSWIKVELIAYE